MKGVLLAGGTGTRMGIVSRAVNKHCNLIYKTPMIMYPLMNLKACGISDVMVVTSEVSAGQMIQLLGNGEGLGMKITYAFQAKANGIAGALALAEDFSEDMPIVVILGDNFFHPHPIDIVQSWDGWPAKIVLHPTDIPREYGVVGTDIPYDYYIDGKVGFHVDSRYGGIFDDDTIMDSIHWADIHSFFQEHPIQAILEKPREYIGNLMVTGMYMYNSSVWDIIRDLTPSGRGELEISDVNTEYLKCGNLTFDIYQGKWFDCGTPDSLLDAATYVRDNDVW